MENLGVSAGCVAPSTKRYVVVYAHEHETLRAGDVVVMVAPPGVWHCLLRMSDMTMHMLTDAHSQYVHLAEASCQN